MNRHRQTDATSPGTSLAGLSFPTHLLGPPSPDPRSAKELSRSIFCRNSKPRHISQPQSLGCTAGLRLVWTPPMTLSSGRKHRSLRCLSSSGPGTLFPSTRSLFMKRKQAWRRRLSGRSWRLTSTARKGGIRGSLGKLERPSLQEPRKPCWPHRGWRWRFCVAGLGQCVRGVIVHVGSDPSDVPCDCWIRAVLLLRARHRPFLLG